MDDKQSARIPLATRIGYVALSGFLGWLAGQIVTLPANLITAVRDSEGVPRLFLESMGLGLVAWGSWTMVLAGGALLFIGLPVALAVRPSLLVRYRGIIFAGVAAMALSLIFVKLRAFRDEAATTRFLRFFEALPYGLFATIFAVVTAWAYISMAKRRMDRMEDDSMKHA
jgi:hypothetical protein